MVKVSNVLRQTLHMRSQAHTIFTLIFRILSRQYKHMDKQTYIYPGAHKQAFVAPTNRFNHNAASTLNAKNTT